MRLSRFLQFNPLLIITVMVYYYGHDITVETAASLRGYEEMDPSHSVVTGGVVKHK